jgi:hypothetical protein
LRRASAIVVDQVRVTTIAVTIAFTVASVVLLLAAPLLTDHTVATAWAEVVNELRPFPEH